MKKLILILTVILLCLCVVACIQLNPADVPEQTQPSTTVQNTTLPKPTEPTPTETVPDGWHEAEGSRYYYENGQPLTGWQEIDGLRRYFLSSGALAKGVAEIDGNRYFFDSEGCYTTGWQEENGKRYYLGEDGVMHTGWLEQESVLYYFKEDGAMARGCVQIDGVNNYFTSTGAYILVVNPWNFMPDGYAPDLKELSSTYASSGNKVDSSCYDALKEMIKACNKTSGHRVCVVSSYRSVSLQTKLFNNQVNRNLKKGYSQEEAERLAAQVVAVPGTSEHHSGLAVDIIDSCCSWELEELQEDLPGQQWLMEHCWEYGFILRYPKDKTEVTGIIYEPWHYRYVGKELAKELHELGLTLEEYLTMLTEEEK